jgi:hypothetical protein
MKELVRIVCLIALMVSGASLLVYSMVYRFLYPELTETQLFFRVWPHSLGGLVLLFLFYVVMLKTGKTK